MKITKKTLFLRIAAITLAVILSLTGLFLFALMMNSMLLGVVSHVSGNQVVVLIARPSTFWFLSGHCPDAVKLYYGEKAAKFSTGDVVLAHAIGAVADSDPPQTGAKFIWRLY